jgi:hypothetical protein
MVLSHFKVLFKRQYKPNHYPLSSLYIIDNYIHHYGLSGIRMIIFYFDTRNSRIYPYGIHPIILKPRQHNLDVVFYHFYDSTNRIIELTTEQKLYDFQNLWQFLIDVNSIMVSLIE